MWAKVKDTFIVCVQVWSLPNRYVKEHETVECGESVV